VADNAQVYGNAWAFGDAMVSDDAKLYCNAQISDDAWAFGDALVSSRSNVGDV